MTFTKVQRRLLVAGGLVAAFSVLAAHGRLTVAFDEGRPAHPVAAATPSPAPSPTPSPVPSPPPSAAPPKVAPPSTPPVQPRQTHARATASPARPAPSPPPAAPPAPPQAPADAAQPGVIPSAANGLRVGLSYPQTLTRMSPADLGQALDDVVALGAGWIRLDLAWDAVQPDSPATWDWSAFDRVAAAAAARHIGVVPILQYTPTWARPLLCSTDHCRPADPNQFAAFAAAAAGRYASQGIHTWEIWNEPNTGGAWMPQPDPAAYAALVQAVAPAIKRSDPAATVISGGLAPAVTDGRDIAQMDFLSAFGRAGGLAAVDAVGYHPYSLPAPASSYDPGNAWQQMANTPTSFQSVLASFGFPGMRVWATEYGAPTNGPGVAATTTDYRLSQNPDHVDEALQAEMAAQSIQLAKGSPLVAALFWYTQTDTGTDPSNREDFFGLRRFDGSAKPAYSALQQAIATARG